MSWKTPPTPNALIDDNSHATSDAVLIVENKDVAVHKSYLSLISPVFKAMFDHPTTEAKTGRVTVTDFSYDVVKAAIDYIYGVPLGDDSIDKILDVYRFVDKYDINAARKQLTKCFEEEINKTNFCTIAKFAWTYSNEHILKKCVAYLASHSNLTLTKDFNKLDGRLILELLRKACDVASNNPTPIKYIPPTRRYDLFADN